MAEPWANYIVPAGRPIKKCSHRMSLPPRAPPRLRGIASAGWIGAEFPNRALVFVTNVATLAAAAVAPAL